MRVVMMGSAGGRDVGVGVGEVVGEVVAGRVGTSGVLLRSWIDGGSAGRAVAEYTFGVLVVAIDGHSR